MELIGEGQGKGYNIHFPFNVPKNENSTEIGDNDFIFACESVLFPIIKDFAPDLIIVSAGFDAAKGDPLGETAVSPVGYAWMTHGLKKI